MPRRKSDTQFKQEVYNLVGDDYTFLESYVNNHTKLRVKHNKCGNIYKVLPNNFLEGTRCPYCCGKIKKTDKQFTKEVFELVGGEYTFLDSYVNNKTKLRVKHNKCGNIYDVTPNNFFTGYRCPYCFGTPKKTNEQFKKEVFALVGDEYTFLEPYINKYTKIKVKHNKCGNVYEVNPNNFLTGHYCPYCAGLAKKNNAQFRQAIYDLVGDEYTFLDSYVNNRTKLRVKHNKCGHVYKVVPSNFLNGSRCPFCNSPKGELIISKILSTLNINYEAQKTFNDLKDKLYLSYDFYIPDQNILIEYQGIQHYQPVEYFGGESQFRLQQKHDKLKLQYAKDHNYNLIAVSYIEDTFSKIKKYLIKHGLKK